MPTHCPTFRLARLPSPEAGQSLVELALVLPIMCALILGAVELGRIAYGSIEVANAAHAAAAYAAQNPTTPYSPYLQTIAADDAADLKAVSTVSTPSCICSSGTNNCSACAVGAHRQDFVTVTVSGNMKTLFGVPGIPSTLTLSSTAVMRMQEEN